MQTSSPLYLDDRSQMALFFKKYFPSSHFQKESYPQLHKKSIQDMDTFWKGIVEYFSPITSGNVDPVKGSEKKQFLPYDWFPNLRLNFAQNLLRFAQTHPHKIALDFYQETGIHYTLTYQELYLSAQYWAHRFQQEFSLKPLDLVCAIMPNCPQTVIFLLAASWCGLRFSSISPDFGHSAIMDRVSQIEPKIIVTVDEYTYGGKRCTIKEKIEALDLGKIPIIYEKYLISSFELPLGALGGPTVPFEHFPFHHPLYVMFSSGTTGKPKCIVHGAGGVLFNHIKELGLHVELQKNQNIFFYTTCGWMMWNWLVSSLYFGSTLVLYDGQPTYPSVGEFLQIINKAHIHIFGTGPKFLKLLEQSQEKINYNFPSLQTILSTGAPLLPEQFEFVYKKFGEKILLGSISGGTDILGCFLMCMKGLVDHRQVNPGYIQGITLGMDVASEDTELVCKTSFPNTPIYFLHDPQNEIYKKSYFSQKENVWYHGDSISINEQGSVIVHGRSDATLNPSGIRIGTSEIYAQVDKIEEVQDSLAIDKTLEGENYIWLFVKLKENFSLTEELIKKIKTKIREQTSARHVPAKIFAVGDLPYTLSGKKMELLISKIMNHKKVDNYNAVSNSECLKDFEQIRDENS